MKKLTFSNSIRIICILLLPLILAQSCKKDKQYIDLTPKFTQQVIKQEVIERWLAGTPAAALLSLDWAHARQTVVDGNKIVRVPTLNVDNTSLFATDGVVTLSPGKSSNGKTMQATTADVSPAGAKARNANYFSTHPPEVFFVQEANSDKLTAKMLNFVPTDPKKEFGQDGVWTGTLFTWNLRGDTLIAKEFVKSKLVDYYGLRNPQTITKKESSVTFNNAKTLSINAQGSFFGWFADLVGDIIGWIAYKLGASVTYALSNDGYGPGWRIDAKMPTMHDDGDGVGGGGGGGPIGGWGSGSNIDNADAIYMTPGSGQNGYDQYPAPDGSGTAQNFNHTKVPATVMYLINVLNTTDPDLMNFMWDKLRVTDAIVRYLAAEGETQQNLAYATWALQYLKDHQSSEDEIDTFITNFLQPSEGRDGDPDATGEIEDFNTQTMPLPTLNAYYNAYPKYLNPNPNGGTDILGISNNEVYAMVGGGINSRHLSGNDEYKNACAVRASWALNYCGYDLPVLYNKDHKQITEKGGDNKNYILSAKEFNTYMHKAFGSPNYSLTSLQIGGNMSIIAPFLVGKTGILSVINEKPGQAGYSGHVDLLISGKAVNATNTNPKGGVGKIEIWILN